MKHLYLLSFLLYASPSLAQTTWGDSLTVQVTAAVQPSPAQITLSWPADNDALAYQVYRKIKGATAWGSILATLPANATGYTDMAVSVNTAYDYKITMTSSGTPTKYGYTASSIELASITNRGIVIVVIEDTYSGNAGFDAAVNQYLKDLEHDAWFVKTLYVSQSDPVATVKSQIVSLYNQNAANTKMVSLIGHVPVPYSGDLNPDGHADHEGAWPTDTYYADMDGTWTDAFVNVTVSSNSKNHNIPGDGKYDDSYLPSNVDVQIGRFDFYDMPAFAASEEELLIRYLNKTHQYKTGQLLVTDQALIDDNFTTYSEGFSQSGYRNFAPLVGTTHIYTNDYFTQLSYNTTSTGTYKWSYGCGGGTYTSAGGIGNSTSFTTDTLSSVFTMLFGSYFGDWDYTNSFLRAPLAQGNTLTNCWAGRPNWHFYHMSIGDPIGYSTQLSQNNSTLYFGSTLGSGLTRLVSINLMGDPSLRMHYMRPPSNLIAANSGGNAMLTWTASPDAVLGYNVYRRYTDSTSFVKVNSSIVAGTNFTDNSLSNAGDVVYYVKAVALQITPTASYYNETLGISDTAFFNVGIHEEDLSMIIGVYPNPATDQVTIDINTESFNGAVITLSDVTGKIFQQINMETTRQVIDVTSLAAGVYYIEISTNVQRAVKKLIVK